MFNERGSDSPQRQQQQKNAIVRLNETRINRNEQATQKGRHVIYSNIY